MWFPLDMKSCILLVPLGVCPLWELGSWWLTLGLPYILVQLCFTQKCIFLVYLHQTVEKLISLVGAASICANAVKQPPILQVFLNAYTLMMVRNIISRTYGTCASCFWIFMTWWYMVLDLCYCPEPLTNTIFIIIAYTF